MDGSIPSGRLLQLAVRRYLWDLEEGHKRGLRLDVAKATEACRFFPECLRHSKGKWAGKPFELSDSQAFIVWNVFGWVRESGLRRFTRSHNEVGRKWGKSELAAGISLKQGTFDDPADPGAEIYLCATKEEQAKTQTFRQICRMVKRSPFLLSRMKVQAKQIVVSEKDVFQPDSVIRPVGNDSDTSDGYDLSGAILDELHAYQKRHQDFYERMTTAGGSREQELVSIFTTAGNDKSETWLELRKVAEQALESVETGEPIYDHLFVFIACLDEDDDPLSMDFDSPEFERTMRKANPNMPVTPNLDYIKRQAQDALASPIGRNKFMRFHGNVKVSSSVQPFPMELLKEWARPIEVMPAFSMGAFDVGRTDDFAAWAIAWQDGEGVRLRAQAYTCAERPEHLQTHQIATWVRDGHLIEHPGSQVDFSALADDIERAHREYGVHHWAMDESFAKLLGQEMQKRLGEGCVSKFI
jgi:phage terminase large subunit-like protein